MASVQVPAPLLPLIADQIPTALRDAKRWAPWTAVWNAVKGKYDKIPWRGLSTAHPDRWHSLGDALAGAEAGGYAGVGYCLTEVHGVVAIDLDRCVEAGAIAPWAQEIINALGSYAELSPSGTGARILCLGQTGRDWTNHERGIEVYAGHTARFVTVTGQRLPDSPIDAVAPPDSVLEALEQRYARPTTATVIDIGIGIPELLDELALPDVATLPLPDAVARFLHGGEHSGDRSRALHAAGVALYAAGLGDAAVLSVLAGNEHAMAIALDHRRQDPERALLYLWREHCAKARGKGTGAKAGDDEFKVVDDAEEGPRLPPYQRDKNGRIEATLGNLRMALSRPDLCGMALARDAFRDAIVRTVDDGDAWQAFEDVDYTRLRAKLEDDGRGFKAIRHDLIRDAVQLIAKDTQIDSAKIWLDALAWDGVPRAARFLHTHLGAADDDYTRAVSLYLWTALAGRVLSPGVKADMVPILSGSQGAAKSSAVEAMASPDGFVEVSFDERDDDLARRMRGRTVAEVSELRGLHTRELEAIKAFVSRTHDDWVPKYQEFPINRPRRLMFIGTTNDEQFLADGTGHRRWLPVRVPGGIDLDAVRRDRDQLWAESAALFTAGGVAYQDAERLAVKAHAEFERQDPWLDDIKAWLDTPDPLTGVAPRTREFLRVSEIAREALRIEPRAFGKREEMRIGEVLRVCGFLRVLRRVDGVVTRVWVARVPTRNHT